MSLVLFTIPLIAAMIGYLTNWVTVKLVFYPQKPIKFLGYSLQGILPKNQEKIAEKISLLVSKEFLSFRDIEQKIASPESLEKILPTVEKHIDNFLHTKLPKAFPMLSMFIGEKTINTLKTAFMEELQALFPVLMSEYVKSLQKDLNLEQLVKAKVDSFFDDQLQNTLYRELSRQFMPIKIMGALIGFGLGLIQVLIVLFMM